MRSIVALFAFFLVSPLAWSAGGFDFTVKASKDGKSIVALPNKGFHFNLDAPNRARLESGKDVPPLKKSEREFSFPAESIDMVTGTKESLRLDLFVCDDAKTFCKQQSVNVTFNEKDEVKVSPWVGKQTSAAEPSTKVVEKNGFLLNGYDEGLARAKKRKKLVLLDFSAIWCPACLKLEHEVLETNDFQKAANDFVKVKIDSDWEGSIPLKSKYHVKDIPTLIVVNADGDELTRIHGFRPKAPLIAELQDIRKQKLVPLTELKARADKGDRMAADKVGRLAYDSLDFATAIHYLKDTKKEKERLLIAEIHQLDEERENDPSKLQALIQKLERAVTLYPTSVDTPSRHLRLAELYKEAKDEDKATAAARASIAASDKLISIKTRTRPLSIDAARDDVELLPGDFWATKARALKLVGNEKDATEAWTKAIDLTKQSIRSAQDRGRRLILVRYLNRSGRSAEVDSVLQELQTAFPNEYTYYYRRASLFHEKGQLDQAEPLARKAVEHAYGSNLVDSALLLAKTLKAKNQPEEAAKTAALALQQVREPEDTTSHLYKQIQELKAY